MSQSKMLTVIQQPSFWTRLLKYLGTAVWFFIFGIYLFYLTILWGFWGSVPGPSELAAIQNPTATEVYAADSSLLGKFYTENRTNVRYEDISEHIIHALIATEDARFFKHGGVDFRSLLRVFFKTILMGNRRSGGGSTISQQLAKNLYPRQRLWFFSMPINKLREMIIARRIEDVYSKEQVLTLYLNTVSFGERAFGIGTATARFFSTSPTDIAVKDAAVLIGMLKAPTAYSPRLYPEKSLQRRNVVLNQMVKKDYLTETEAETLKQLPLDLKYNRSYKNEGLALHYRQQLKEELRKHLSEQTKPDGTAYNIYTDGLKVYTTIEPLMQRHAEATVKEHMTQLQEAFYDHWGKERPWDTNNQILTDAVERSPRYRALQRAGKSRSQIQQIFKKELDITVYTPIGPIQERMSPMDSVMYYLYFMDAGFMVMNPQTGHVKAWVGSINFNHFRNDNVTGKRQVGSTFKPFVYAAALEQGIAPCAFYPNEQITYKDYDNWTPRNADNEYGGAYSLQGALAKSVNTVSVQLIFDAGIEQVVRLAKSAGITSTIPQVPSIALGTAEISLAEMVSAYSAFANGGRKTQPLLWTKIYDSKGRLITENKNAPAHSIAPIMSEETTRIMTKLLQQVVDEGTGKKLRTQYQLHNDIAGKTGTTQNHSDGWFIGYTSDLVAGVWVGAHDRRVRFRTLREGQASRTALPIWGSFFSRISKEPPYKNSMNRPLPDVSQATAEAMDCPLYAENPDAVDTKSAQKEKKKKSFLERIRERIWGSPNKKSSGKKTEPHRPSERGNETEKRQIEERQRQQKQVQQERKKVEQERKKIEEERKRIEKNRKKEEEKRKKEERKRLEKEKQERKSNERIRKAEERKRKADERKRAAQEKLRKLKER